MNATGHTHEPQGLYDSTILEKEARGILGRARNIVVLYAVFGFVVGSLAAAFAPLPIPNVPPLAWALFLLFGSVATAIALGNTRAFTLRVQAQTLLCQVQIERNTRRIAEASQPVAERAAS